VGVRVRVTVKVIILCLPSSSPTHLPPHHPQDLKYILNLLDIRLGLSWPEFKIDLKSIRKLSRMGLVLIW
jgi:hypothetical protein